jgi:sigma-E factor negative regulatory protein RseC
MIEHQGIIEQINGNHITVRILQQSACANCHAKGACMAVGSKEKRIDIFAQPDQFGVNEEVVIVGKESIGYKAILWAFVIPLMILVTVLILTLSVWKFNELASALCAIIALTPYYVLLYTLRKKIAKSLVFSIKKKEF